MIEFYDVNTRLLGSYRDSKHCFHSTLELFYNNCQNGMIKNYFLMLSILKYLIEVDETGLHTFG